MSKMGYDVIFCVRNIVANSLEEAEQLARESVWQNDIPADIDGPFDVSDPDEEHDRLVNGDYDFGF